MSQFIPLINITSAKEFRENLFIQIKEDSLLNVKKLLLMPQTKSLIEKHHDGYLVCLIAGVYRNDLDFMKYLIKKIEETKDEITWENKMVVFNTAAQNSSVEIVQYLNEKWDMNQQIDIQPEHYYKAQTLKITAIDVNQEYQLRDIITQKACLSHPLLGASKRYDNDEVFQYLIKNLTLSKGLIEQAFINRVCCGIKAIESMIGNANHEVASILLNSIEITDFIKQKNYEFGRNVNSDEVRCLLNKLKIKENLQNDLSINTREIKQSKI